MHTLGAVYSAECCQHFLSRYPISLMCIGRTGPKHQFLVCSPSSQHKLYYRRHLRDSNISFGSPRGTRTGQRCLGLLPLSPPLVLLDTGDNGVPHRLRRATS